MYSPYHGCDVQKVTYLKSFQTIRCSHNDKVATVTLNRPDVHNAMNEQLMKEVIEIFTTLSKDPTVRVIVLTGEGKSFCAGADLNWMKSMVTYSEEENVRDSQLLLTLYNAIDSCPKPVIGRIKGHAFGGGLGLIAVCDVAVALPSLKFAFSEAKLGIMPSVISTFVAPRIGLAQMRRFFMTAERFDSSVAQQIGLLDVVVPPEEFDQTIEHFVGLMKTSGPHAIQEIKHLLSQYYQLDRDAFKTFTVEKIAKLRVSQEGQEGITAFLEKRKPQWSE